MTKLSDLTLYALYKVFVILTITTLPSNVFSHDTMRAKDLDELSLQDFLDVEIVSVTKKAQKISQAPAKVIVTTAKQIKAHGYFTLGEALTDLAGFQFCNIQGFNSYLFMRGIPNQNNKIMVRIDGIQINELNSGGFYGGEQFNLINVKQIEDKILF